MHFTVTDKYIFPWPVLVRHPDHDKPGSQIEQKFIGTFVLLDEESALSLIDAVTSASDARSSIEASKAQIRKVLVGWDADVRGVDGPLAFTSENLEICLSKAAFRKGVLDAYALAVSGKAVEGN